VPVDDLCWHDLLDVMAVVRRCFVQPWDLSGFVAELTNPRSHGLVFREEAWGCVGFAVYWRIGEEMEILNVGVDPARRRHGYGARLVEAMLARASRTGVRRAYLEVRQSNVAARRLYAVYQFEAVAVRRGYYQRDGEDAVIMRRELVP